MSFPVEDGSFHIFCRVGHLRVVIKGLGADEVSCFCWSMGTKVRLWAKKVRIAVEISDFSDENGHSTSIEIACC